MTAEERLAAAELPAVIWGCDLSEGPDSTYDIQSRGPLGGRHGTLFRAAGDDAEIVGIAKIGWIGQRYLDVPIEKHVQVLREFGFTEVVFPDGKRYELRTWPGVRRVRD